MIWSKRKKNKWFPYGDLVTKILEHFGFNLEEEESQKNLTVIGKFALGKMWIEINNGVLILKLMKEKKFAQSQQAPPQQGGTSILEEFDNEIPYTTPNEALL